MALPVDFQEPSLAVSAMFYVGLGLWWHTQTVKAYWSAVHRRIEFQSAVTHTCCHRLRNAPVEGMIKLISTVIVCIVSAYRIGQTSDRIERNQAVGQLTVFAIFTVSCAWEILSSVCRRLALSNVDYFLVLVCFNTQSIVLSYHTEVKDSWMAVADTCAMFAATGVGVAILFEYRFSECIWLPISRAFCVFVLGTWLTHIVLMSNLYKDVEVPQSNMTVLNVSISKADVYMLPAVSTVDLLPMYFTWHCFVAMTIFVILWLIVYKMCNRGWCVCVPVVEENQFENHVRFDYHFLDRMTDSDHE